MKRAAPLFAVTRAVARLGDASRSRAGVAAIGVLCLIALGTPLLLVDVPPLTDYPNHLAREYVLAFGRNDPFLSRMYQTDWSLIPNLAIDVVMPNLARIMSIYDAGRIMLAFAILMPVVGIFVYHRAVFGRWSTWPFASALVAYSGLFLLGFMNYEISLGLALLAAAGWVTWRDRRPVLTMSVAMGMSLVIFFAHLFGLVFLGAIIGGFELQRLVTRVRERRPWLRDLGRTAGLACSFLPALVLTVCAPIASAGGRMIWRPLGAKLFLLLQPFLVYDAAVGKIVGACFLLTIYLLARQRRFTFAPGCAWSLLGLFAAYLACPFIAQGTGFISDRFPVMMAFLLIAGGHPRALQAPARGAVVLALATLFLAKTISIDRAWLLHRTDLSSLRSTIALVPPGAKVLAVAVSADDNPGYWRSAPPGRDIPYLLETYHHLPALLLIERKAFWPGLFTAVGKQPLRLRPPFDRLDGLQDVPPDYHVLEHDPIDPADLRRSPYLVHWDQDFDYVLLLNAGGLAQADGYLPGKLALLRRTDMAALYRIRRAD